MRMCGINQVHGGFTHQHTHRVYILHTQHTHTHTHSARNTNTEAVPMALKGISQSFWLEHFNRVFYCAHILCRLCSKFSSLAGMAHVLVTMAHKVENSLEPNISESLHVCWWVCLWPVVLRCGVVFSATAGAVREKPQCGTLCALKFPTWGNTRSQKGENATAKEMRNVCTLLRGRTMGCGRGAHHAGRCCSANFCLALPLQELINPRN